MMDRTGCDGVMIARGALGYPWIFREAAAIWEWGEAPPPPTEEERIAMLMEHFQLLVANKGERVAVREIRKHTRMVCKGDERRRGSQAQDQHHYRCGGDETSYTFETGISPCLFYI